ncbi:unnamed protein product, partial [Polarella glacialis]
MAAGTTGLLRGDFQLLEQQIEEQQRWVSECKGVLEVLLHVAATGDKVSADSATAVAASTCTSDSGDATAAAALQNAAVSAASLEEVRCLRRPPPVLRALAAALRALDVEAPLKNGLPDDLLCSEGAGLRAMAWEDLQRWLQNFDLSCAPGVVDPRIRQRLRARLEAEGVTRARVQYALASAVPLHDWLVAALREPEAQTMHGFGPNPSAAEASDLASALHVCVASSVAPSEKHFVKKQQQHRVQRSDSASAEFDGVFLAGDPTDSARAALAVAEACLLEMQREAGFLQRRSKAFGSPFGNALGFTPLHWPCVMQCKHLYFLPGKAGSLHAQVEYVEAQKVRRLAESSRCVPEAPTPDTEEQGASLSFPEPEDLIEEQAISSDEEDPVGADLQVSVPVLRQSVQFTRGSLEVSSEQDVVL